MSPGRPGDPLPGHHLWLDPSFGAAGDMLLGALLGLGAPLDAVRADLETLDVPGWSLALEPVSRAGIDAVRAVVDTEGEDHPHRAWSTIDALLASAALPAPVADGARRTFELLGRTEAAIHRVELDQVHFHEVGAVDAIVDIVGVWSARYHLGPTRVTVGPVGLGRGHVGAAHGRLPTPAPATASLLRGAPVHSVDIEAETVTPTGAALLITLADDWGPIPSGLLGPVSRGAGGRNPTTHPNVVTAIAVEPTAAPTVDGGDLRSLESVVLATNLDDVTPEVLAHTIDRLLAAGADDAWLVPVVMKKSRPGHELRVLARPDRVDGLRRLVLAETGSLGIRTETVRKHEAPRSVHQVEVRGHRIAVKVGPHHRKPEFDDLQRVALATGLPLKQLAAEALAADSPAPHVTFDHSSGHNCPDDDDEQR